jgi:Protein of unknown function (DUF3501)
MPRDARTLIEADILPLAMWGEQRSKQRRDLSDLKRHRRVPIGPHATLYFENWDTMWYQVQEMLWIEKGGAAQLPDELAAYNPLIPQGNELVATLMFEIPDPAKRAKILLTLGGVEDTVSIAFGGVRILGRAEGDLERTTAAGKTSAVHFLHFGFTDAQALTFCDDGGEVMIRVDHPNYGHAAILSPEVRAALAEDLG